MPLQPVAIFFILLLSIYAHAESLEYFWLELKAENKAERNHIADLGFDIVSVEKDRVIVLASMAQLKIAHSQNLVLGSYRSGGVTPFDFPAKDGDYHNYQELSESLADIAAKNKDIVELSSIGISNEGREIWAVRVSATSMGAMKKSPAALFVGGHHAREHVSVEVPLRLLNYLVEQYRKKDTRIVSLLGSTEVFIVPVLNPDGVEYDVATGVYRSWRKNRRLNADRSYGVDLNRNYSTAWGTTGTSGNPSSDTYRGPNAFSEPETQAFKNYVESHSNISLLISYHTFGENVLWPWSYSDDEVSNAKDLRVFQVMGKKMAQLTGYTPMKSGELYLSSGDTCDWAYADHGIFAFTFELDPQNPFSGGFYPAQSALDGIFKKNVEPAIYLMESAKDPYQVSP
jgi:carboxypeptidase T